MVIFAIDDEENSLEYLVKKIKEVCPSEDLVSYMDAQKALKDAKENVPDVIFLDIEMPGINGIEVAKKFKAINLNINFIFVTGYSEYTMDAFKVDASGYLLKPATKEQIKHALDNLRYEIKDREDKKLCAQCFGNFELFYGKEPIKFKYKKSKEVLAYLIDRKGAMCNNEEIISALWEDDEDHLSYFRSLVKDIHDSLKAISCENVFIKQWNGIAIDKSVMHCDYYEYLDGRASGINSFRGEYMTQYSWAEETTGLLTDFA